MHEHICIYMYNSPMVKLRDQINVSISMEYTTSAKKFSELFIKYGAGFAFDNFACTFIGIKSSVLNKYLKTIKRCTSLLV